MNTLTRLFGTIGLLAIGALPNAKASVVITNHFDADPGWAGVNNTSGGNSYENYYADTNSFQGEYFSLGHALQGSGRFDARNVSTFTGGAEIGHRSASTSDQTFLGLHVVDLDASNVRIRAFFQRSDGVGLGSSLSVVPINGDYWFSYSYNPNSGGSSQGQLSLTVTNSTFSNTFTVDLTAADRAVGGVLDAFGVGSNPLSFPSASNTGDIFIDDVSFTAIPEPSAVALLGAGTLLLGRQRRLRVR